MVPLQYIAIAFAVVHVIGLPIFFSRLIASGVERVDRLYLPQSHKIDDAIAALRKEVVTVKADAALSKPDRRCVMHGQRAPFTRVGVLRGMPKDCPHGVMPACSETRKQAEHNAHP